MTLLSTASIVPVFDLAWACRHEHLITYGTVTTISIGGTYRLLYPRVLKNLTFSCMIKMDLLVDLTMSATHIFSVASYCYLFTSHLLSTCEFLSTLLVALMMVSQVVSALLVNMLWLWNLSPFGPCKYSPLSNNRRWDSLTHDFCNMAIYLRLILISESRCIGLLYRAI
jgi:hypothetical protein